MVDYNLIAQVVVAGIVIVFGVLLLLIGLIKLMGIVVGYFENRSKAPKKTQEPAAAKVSEPVTATVVSDEDEDELIAVISAAVAATLGDGKKFVIKSVKRNSQGRSSWGQAGVLNNTQPF